MTKYILHGGYDKKDNELNMAFIKEVGRDMPDKFKLLFVFFAVDKSGYEQEFKEYKELFNRNLKDKKIEYCLADKKNFVRQTKDADIIYLRGGNTLKLLNALKKYDYFKNVIRGKVVVGSSAGACALAKYFYSNNKNKEGVFKGLGILPVKIICHYKEKGHNKAVEELGKYFKDMELVLLKDFEHKVYRK